MKPWLSEPDSDTWVTQAGYPARINRVKGFGHLCGYVGLKSSHPASRVDYSELPVSPHRGVTYGAFGEDGLYWVGFDCAHYGDLIPLYAESGMFRIVGEIYRDFSYVRQQCEGLAAELADIADGE